MYGICQAHHRMISVGGWIVGCVTWRNKHDRTRTTQSQTTAMRVVLPLSDLDNTGDERDDVDDAKDESERRHDVMCADM